MAGPAIEVTLTSVGGDLAVRLHASVARTTIDPASGPVRLGIEFGPMADAAREKLDFLVARVVEGTAPAPLDGLSAQASPREIREALAQVPAAQRAALAARAMPREREILMQDTDPNVLDALARNPNLTPPELHGLLRSKQVLPRTLEHLARDGRATGIDDVKIAIACHPNAPFALAERLISTLTPEARKRAVLQPGLAPALRMKFAQDGRRRERR
jgi:hypothetical protein